MSSENVSNEEKGNGVLANVRRSSHRTICQQPLPQITCCYLLYGMGSKKWFEFYKGEDKIKEIFSASYFDALAEFMEWYKNYA